MTANDLIRRIFSFRTALALCAGVLPAVLVIIFGFLVVYAWPAIGFNGLDFVTKSNWNVGDSYGTPVLQNGILVPPGAQFDVLFLIGGTVLTVLIAIVIAFPVGIAAAIFLAEVVPSAIRSFVSFFVELLAAVPSVVFGLWGIGVITAFPDAAGHSLFVRFCAWLSGEVTALPAQLAHLPLIGPLFGLVFDALGAIAGWLDKTPLIGPALHWLFGFLGGVYNFFGGDPGNGYSLLAAGIVLSFMIVPLITSTVRDALISQPASLREASVALGAKRFETIHKILLPSVRGVTIGATILAIGRALGETMAVLMVCGNSLALPHNLYDGVSTMASFIASQLDSAGSDSSGLVVKSLAEIAVVLGLMSVVVNTGARIVLAMSGAGQPKDR